MPSREIVLSFVQKAQTFKGTPVQRLLHQQRLARRIASEHQRRFSPEDLMAASRLSPTRPEAGRGHRTFNRAPSPSAERLGMPPADAVTSFAQQAQTFEGTPVQRLLHQQRLARRIANEHQQRFSAEDLMSAAKVGAPRARPS
jgi:hypothetical protein